MASKDKAKTAQKRVVVRKQTSPYAPMLKLVYRALIGFSVLVVIWLGYEIFETARAGMKQHEQQQKHYREAMGIKDKQKQEEQEEQMDEEEGTESEQEGDGN